MSAMARNLPGEALDETIVHEPDNATGPYGSAGTSDMPDTTPQGQNRYIYGSGASPLEGYTIKRAVGRGGFGEVYYATSDAGKEVALKLITRNLDIERRGVMQCMNLKSPHLITIYDLKTTESGDTFVIMEYVAGPSLANILSQHPGGMPLHDVRSWMKGLVEGVEYLHDHGIVHRDLKPANLFMEQGVVKIGDYGLSKLITQSQRVGHSESIGTCHYMAPEISTGKYNKPIDIYAMGVILFEMITGRVPFDGETVGEILMKHLTARPELSVLPEPYRTIVGKAMAKDPAQRPGRVVDLLIPEDAPKAPKLRFIGEKNGTTAVVEEPKPEQEEVLRIGNEEPVFYIGPDTRPPVRRGGAVARRFWAVGPWVNQARNRVRPAAARPAAAARPLSPARRPTPASPRPAAPPPPPPPAPVLPPLPSPRVRVAELASSMLWVAPLALVFAFPASGLLGIDVARQPQQIAYLFGMTLLGTWSVLVPNKFWEGRSVDNTTRRLVYFASGLLVGSAGLMLSEWTQVRLHPSFKVEGPGEGLLAYTGPLERPGLLGYTTYFGLLFGANGWWKLTSRGRQSRLRIFPVIKVGLVALVLAALWPFSQPWGICVAVLIAMLVQLVSPWNEGAAAFAHYSAARRKTA